MDYYFHNGSLHVVVRDNWQESKHPRDPEGKFAEKGGGYQVSKNLKTQLVGAGFTPIKGSKAFEHPSGIKITIEPPEPGKTSSTNWTSYKEGHQPIKGKGTSLMGILQRSMKQQQKVQKSQLPSSPESKYMEPVEMSSLHKVSGKLGSNEGGVYVDNDGNKYYIKTPASEQQARQENLAANLYRLAGSNTLTYVNVGPDKVATKWEEPQKKNINQFTPEEIKQVQNDFAIHAWLANWDCIGLNGDNQIVINGKPTSVDMGGSLLYRAKGSTKPFDSTVPEFTTLRDPAKAPQAAKIFAPMTTEQVEKSLLRLKNISDAQIREVVKALDPKSQNLADVLIARKNNLLSKIGAPEPKVYSSFVSKAPVPTPKQQMAISHYGGSGYRAINNTLRNGDAETETIVELTDYLNKCSLDEEITVSRKVSGEYSKVLKSIAFEGAIFEEKGFMSTSISTGVWSGNLQMMIKAPKGSKGVAISHLSGHSGEKEILFQRNSKLKITKIQGNTFYAELIQ